MTTIQKSEKNDSDMSNYKHPKDCECDKCEVKFEPPEIESPPHY